MSIWYLFLENIKIDDMSSFLEHPFVLLITGASISTILVTVLTQKWQNKKNQFDLKVSLVNEIAETSTLLVAALMSINDGSVNREKEEKAIIQSRKLETNLYSHFPDTRLADEWNIYSENAVNLWYISTYLKDKKQNKFHQEVIEAVKIYFTKTFPTIKVEWDKILNDYSQSEFLIVRSNMFGYYRYFVKKVQNQGQVNFAKKVQNIMHRFFKK